MPSLSRAFILKWMQDLEIPLKRIEDVGKGTALCMVLKAMDSSFPKFKEDPQTRNDYLSNLQLVQQYFERRNVKLYFPVDKMVNLKMQDNLEVIQWFYRYWARETQEGGTEKEEVRLAQKPISGCKTKETPRILVSTVSHINSQEADTLKQGIEEMKHTVLQKQLHIEKIQEHARIFQSERDFYFNKLLTIEKLLKDDSYKLTNDTKKEILRMMYQN